MKLPVNYRSLSPWQRAKVRTTYRLQQGDMCHHCKASLQGAPAPSITALPVNKALFPRGFFEHPVHLHHSHKTGLTIGAVHALCNAVLWQHHGE